MSYPVQGLVVWVTGAPSAGKSTLARRLLEDLRASDIAACLLDGDDVRACLVPEVGYTPSERDAFYFTLANVAAMLARQSLVVLVAATAQCREFRARARELAPAFLEVWVDTPPDECARRDTKGLYAASRAGALRDVPGANVAYEAPLNPDFVAHGGEDAAASDAVRVGIREMLSGTRSASDAGSDGENTAQ
jgi:adenylylsulfate kinase